MIPCARDAVEKQRGSCRLDVAADMMRMRQKTEEQRDRCGRQGVCGRFSHAVVSMNRCDLPAAKNGGTEKTGAAENDMANGFC